MIIIFIVALWIGLSLTYLTGQFFGFIADTSDNIIELVLSMGMNLIVFLFSLAVTAFGGLGILAVILGQYPAF